VNKKPLREDLDAFESAYNAACGCIARGELSQADILLNRAKRMYIKLSPKLKLTMVFRTMCCFPRLIRGREED
jgi:hypothetical protein